MSHSLSQRGAGRPRLYADDAIFEAIHQIIRRNGFPELTLERVALEVGCTRQALVRRFGSKERMLLAAVDATAASVLELYGHVRTSADSPLAALRARMVLPPNSRPATATEAREQANLLAFMLTLSTDPEFGQRFAALRHVSQAEIEELLRDAMRQQELAAVDVVALANVLLAATTGELLNMCAEPSLDQGAMLGAIFDQIVAPYRASLDVPAA